MRLALRVLLPSGHPKSALTDKVTFRIRAPKATEVAVAGQWTGQRAPMTRETNEV
jgi:hypothetical protein